jgi:hypothetical protein
MVPPPVRPPFSAICTAASAAGEAPSAPTTTDSAVAPTRSRRESSYVLSIAEHVDYDVYPRRESALANHTGFTYFIDRMPVPPLDISQGLQEKFANIGGDNQGGPVGRRPGGIANAEAFASATRNRPADPGRGSKGRSPASRQRKV